MAPERLDLEIVLDVKRDGVYRMVLRRRAGGEGLIIFRVGNDLILPYVFPKSK
jgi:hypothetical protein